jgi:hypothetical protein
MRPSGDFSAIGVPGSGRSGIAQSIALLAVFAAELALFWVSTAHHYAWVYPRWFDQQQYLLEAYGCYDQMRAGGFISGARQALATISPQGSLHGFFALIAQSVAGPSRNAALSVNLFAFLALQASTFLAVRRVSGSFAFAWAAVGLLLAVHSPWAGNAGSATDFRLDWMGACAYGVALAAGVSGNGFRSARGAVLFGIAVGIALLTRHLTAVYFGLVYGGLFAWLLFQPDRWRRSGHLALSGVCALGVSGWAFWRSRHEIYSYYWTGQFVLERTLRDSHMGILACIKWLTSEVLFQQIGIAATVLGAAAGAVLFASGIWGGKADRAPAGDRRDVLSAWPVVLAFMAAPAAVLLIHPEKTPQTLNIMIPATAWAIVLAWIRLSRGAGQGAIVATCAVVGLAGAGVFARTQLRNPFSPEMESEFRSVNTISDYLYFRAQESGLSRPSVAATRIFDGLIAESFDMVGRERHRTRLRFIAMLPSGLQSNEPSYVMAGLAGSDFVCLVTRGPLLWPFDRQMESMMPHLQEWCDRNLRRDGEVNTAEFSVTVYERPSLMHPSQGGIDLAAMESAASREPPYAPAALPGPPLMTMPRSVSWTTRSELRYIARAAYTPVTYRGEGMPPGIKIDPFTGEIRGKFRSPGKYETVVIAANAAGSARADVTFVVSDQVWDESIDPPDKATVGVPVSIGFSAFDSLGTLDFIDVNDLTTGKFITRIAANDDERQNWHGSFQATLQGAGQHSMKMRFVRFDPAGGTYTFGDRDCVISVGP